MVREKTNRPLKWIVGLIAGGFLLYLLSDLLLGGNFSPGLFWFLTVALLFWQWRRQASSAQRSHDELRSLLNATDDTLRTRISAVERALADLKTARPVVESADVSRESKSQAPPPSATSFPLRPTTEQVSTGHLEAPLPEEEITASFIRPPFPAIDTFEHPSSLPPLAVPTARRGQTIPRFDVGGVKWVLNLERILGENWLSKLGMVILVLGIAFFLAWQLREVGPTGKVVVGWMVSLALIAAGVFGERHLRYRLLARGAVGGGWALLFFTAYAMFHIPAARVLSSQVADLFLMFVVAAAMVLHTLRYESQVVTSLTFLLAFSTIAFNRTSEDVYGLSANLILALGLSVVVVRMRWFEMEVFGILAAYLNHYFWLQPIIAPMGSHHHPFPEFYASTAMLILYWAIFRFSYVIRDAGSQENVSTVAALLNTFLLLAVLRYQSVYKWMAFWALLALGAVELTLGQLPLLKARQRRAAFIILTTVGAALLLAAIPFRYAPEYVSIIWLAEAETFLLAGILTGEIWFRRLGLLAALPIAIQMLAVDAARVMGERFDGAFVAPGLKLAMVFGLATLLFYANAHLYPRRRADLLGLLHTDFDRLLCSRISYLAGTLAFAGCWIAFPRSYAVVAWMVVSMSLAWAGSRWNVKELSVQANFMAGLAVLRVLLVNLRVTDSYAFAGYHVRVRFVSIFLVTMLLYGTARWTRFHLDLLKRHNAAVLTWPASILLGLLAWYELNTLSVALAWMLIGLVLLEAGLHWKLRHLRLQAYLASVLAFARIFFANLNASGDLHALSPRIYTVTPLVIAFFYIYQRLQGNAHSPNADYLAPESSDAGSLDAGSLDSERVDLDRRILAAKLHAYLAMLALAALVRFEAPLDWVAAAWSAIVLLLVTLAYTTQRRIFLGQAIWLSLAVLFRTSTHNFYVRNYFTAPSYDSRWWSVGVACGLMLLALPLAFRLRRPYIPDLERSRLSAIPRLLDSSPEQVLFFIPMLLFTVLIALEMRKGLVTMTWGFEGVMVFLFALWVGERSYRLAGVGLLLLCVGKIVLVDIWGLNIRDRAFTFIALGVSLLLVSILYTRHRESIRQYL